MPTSKYLGDAQEAPGVRTKHWFLVPWLFLQLWSPKRWQEISSMLLKSHFLAGHAACLQLSFVSSSRRSVPSLPLGSRWKMWRGALHRQIESVMQWDVFLELWHAIHSHSLTVLYKPIFFARHVMLKSRRILAHSQADKVNIIILSRNTSIIRNFLE